MMYTNDINGTYIITSGKFSIEVDKYEYDTNEAVRNEVYTELSYYRLKEFSEQ